MSVIRRVGIGMAIGGLTAGALSGSAGAAATASDKAHAKSALVTLSDLPTGWTSTPQPSTSAGTSSGASSGSSQLARCIGVPTKLIANNPPRQVSPLYKARGGTEVVQDTVSIYPTAAYAKAVYAALSSRKAPDCIAAELNGANAAAGSSGHVTVRRVESPKGTAAYTLATTMAQTGGTTSGTSTEVVYFFKGRFGNGLDVETSGSQPPVALSQHLLAMARGRL